MMSYYVETSDDKARCFSCNKKLAFTGAIMWLPHEKQYFCDSSCWHKFLRSKGQQDVPASN